MSAATLMRDMVGDGLRLSLTPQGTIHFEGPQHVVDRYLPSLREYKPDIIAALAHDNAPPPQAPAPSIPASEWQSVFDNHLGDLRRAHPNGIQCGPLENIAFARCQGDWITKHLPPYPVPFDQVEYDRRNAQSRAALIADGLPAQPPLEVMDRGLYDTRTRNAVRDFMAVVDSLAALNAKQGNPSHEEYAALGLAYRDARALYHDNPETFARLVQEAKEATP